MKTINKIRVNNFKGMIEMTENGETLIKKIQRILDENEPLTDGAPMIYTPKQAGVREDCNVRTDKWALAMNAMDRVNNYKLNEYLKKGEACDKSAKRVPDGSYPTETPGAPEPAKKPPAIVDKAPAGIALPAALTMRLPAVS